MGKVPSQEPFEHPASFLCCFFCTKSQIRGESYKELGCWGTQQAVGVASHRASGPGRWHRVLHPSWVTVLGALSGGGCGDAPFTTALQVLFTFMMGFLSKKC